MPKYIFIIFVFLFSNYSVATNISANNISQETLLIKKQVDTKIENEIRKKIGIVAIFYLILCCLFFLYISLRSIELFRSS
jgi:hypothetical protein